MIDAVIFDMDGLLIDSEPFWREAEKAVFAAVGLTLTDAMCEETVGVRVNEVIRHWYQKRPWPSPNLETMETDIIEGVAGMIRERGRLLPGVESALEFLKRRRVPVALASSSASYLIHTFLEGFGLAEAFAVTHSAETEEYGKPHPAVYLSTANKLGVDPTRCLAIEDSFNGVLSAKAARMACAAVPDPRHWDHPRWGVADVKLRSLGEFDAALFDALQRGTAPDEAAGPRTAALAFVDGINRHDVAALAALMTEDHVFADALDNRVAGRRAVRDGWRGYFAWFPDYRIEVADAAVFGDTVLLTGYAGGMYAHGTEARDRWRLPAAWRAVVREGLVSEWRVYADTKVVFDILNRHIPR